MAQSSAPEPAAEAVANDTVENDIVVTARRREESLQSVPIAVTALSGDALKSQQVSDARGLEGLVPSLNVNSGNSRDGARYTLRGQGATLAAGESVAVYFAEAPIPQFISGGPGFYYDLANVQVLNGPQGTLFGRNTTGGAILFTPTMPTDKLEGYVEAAYGNYDNVELNGAINIPIVEDKVLLRVSGLFRKRDGFTYNKRDGSYLDNLNYWSARAILTINLTETLTNTTIYSYLHSTSKGTGFLIDYVNAAGPIRFVPAYLAQAQAELALRPSQGNRVTNSDSDSFFRTRAHTLVNTTTLEVGDLTVKNIFSYFKTRLANGFDIDGTLASLVGYGDRPDANQPSAVPQSHENYYTNELQLQGTSLAGKLDWVVGAYYHTYDPAGITKAYSTSFGALSYVSATDSGKTTALFAQGTLDLGVFVPGLDGLKFTGGYRYTWDDRQSFANNRRASDGLCTGTGGTSGLPAKFDPNCGINFAKKYSQGTYTLGLDWQVTPSTLVYATTRKGYKSGGFNTNSLPNQPFASFEPERVTDYEIGLKTQQDLGGMPVRFNVALFENRYKDIQRNLTTTVPNSSPPSVTNYVFNAASAKIRGVEAQVRIEPVKGFAIDAVYSYLDAKYGSFVLNGVNLNGLALPYSPNHKFSINPSFTIPTSLGGDIVLRMGYSYQSSYRAGDVDQPGNIVAARGLLNAGIDWRNVADSKLDLSFFVTNLTNKSYVAQPLTYYFNIGTVANSYGEPRMYGLRVKYNFGD